MSWLLHTLLAMQAKAGDPVSLSNITNAQKPNMTAQVQPLYSVVLRALCMLVIDAGHVLLDKIAQRFTAGCKPDDIML